jgi:hypothetical protein
MEPIPKADYIGESDYYDHWFTNEIADYVDEYTDRSNDIEWLKNHAKGFVFGVDDNGEYFVVKDKGEYFERNFNKFMEVINNIKDITIEDFTKGISNMWTLKNAYEDEFGFYVNADGETMTLDSFVRGCAMDAKYYIGATIDYHW